MGKEGWSRIQFYLQLDDGKIFRLGAIVITGSSSVDQTVQLPKFPAPFFERLGQHHAEAGIFLFLLLHKVERVAFLRVDATHAQCGIECEWSDSKTITERNEVDSGDAAEKPVVLDRCIEIFVIDLRARFLEKESGRSALR